MSLEHNEIPAEEPIAVLNETEEQTVVAPEAEPAPEKKTPKQKKKPHIALRVVLQIISLLLATVLFATAVSGVLLLDLRQLTSAGGIKQLIGALVSSSFSAPAPEPVVQSNQFDGVYLSRLSAVEEPAGTLPDGDISVDEDGNISVGGGSSIDLDQLPEDILTGGGSAENIDGLIDWLYEQIDSTTDEELTVTKEQMKDFVEKSTVSDFLADKLAEYADDFINGTENANITTDEIMDLLEENEDLLKSELNIELNQEQKDALRGTFTQIVEDANLGETIREQVNATVENVLQENAGALEEVVGEEVDLSDIQNGLQALTSTALIIGFVAAFVVLIALLCLANFYNVPAGLTWAGVPCILAGGILSLPIALLQNSSEVFTDLMPDAAAVVNLLASFAGVFAPIHYGLLILGAALVVISIIWRIIRKAVRKKAAK